MRTLMRLSFPSSQRVDDRVEHLPKRRRVVTVRDSDSTKEDSFVFEDVYAMRVTYHHACSDEMRAAYDCLMEFDDSSWLREIQDRVTTAGGPADHLRHYRIYLDDGPCYEFISGSYKYSPESA